MIGKKVILLAILFLFCDCFGDLAYIPTFYSKLYVLDTESNRIVAGPIPINSGAVGVAATHDFQKVYTANLSSNSVSVIETATSQFLTNIFPGDQPYAIAINSEGIAYVSESSSQTVSRIDTNTDTVIGAPIPLPAQGFGIVITPDEKFLYVVVEHGLVCLIDTMTNMIVASINLPNAASYLAISPNGQYVYVPCENSDSVVIISTANNQIVGSITTDRGPLTIGITPDGLFAYTGNLETVSVIDLSMNTIVGEPIPVGETSSLAITLDGKYVYLPNRNNTITVINTSTNSVERSIRFPGYGTAIAMIILSRW